MSTVAGDFGRYLALAHQDCIFGFAIEILKTKSF
jgi:hypothetical protein